MEFLHTINILLLWSLSGLCTLKSGYTKSLPVSTLHTWSTCSFHCWINCTHSCRLRRSFRPFWRVCCCRRQRWSQIGQTDTDQLKRKSCLKHVVYLWLFIEAVGGPAGDRAVRLAAFIMGGQVPAYGPDGTALGGAAVLPRQQHAHLCRGKKKSYFKSQLMSCCFAKLRKAAGNTSFR